jgi:hypothetical protein
MPKNMEELENFAYEEWAKIEAEMPQLLENLATHYSNRLKAVIEANGGNTIY